MENPEPPIATGQPPASHPEILQLLTRMQSGASWFFWIAGLSIVNSIAAVSEANVRFVIGLGATELIDAFAHQAGGAGKTIGLALDFCAAGIFALFGVFARKGNTVCFIIGMILYTLDGLLLLPFGQWLSIGFHAFALYCIFLGFAAQRKLVQVAEAQSQQA